MYCCRIFPWLHRKHILRCQLFWSWHGLNLTHYLFGLHIMVFSMLKYAFVFSSSRVGNNVENFFPFLQHCHFLHLNFPSHQHVSCIICPHLLRKPHHWPNFLYCNICSLTFHTYLCHLVCFICFMHIYIFLQFLICKRSLSFPIIFLRGSHFKYHKWSLN
jgi:hypothetical protein